MRVVWFRGSYYAYWRDGSQSKRTALRTQDRELAERRLRDLELSLRKKAVTVAEMLDTYLADKAGNPWIANLTFALKPVRPVFGHLRPDQIDRALCRAYRAQRHRQGVKDGTVIKELSTMRAALRWADKNTPAIVELPPTPPPRSRHLTRDQYRDFARCRGIAAPALVCHPGLQHRSARRRTARADVGSGGLRPRDDPAGDRRASHQGARHGADDQ